MVKNFPIRLDDLKFKYVIHFLNINSLFNEIRLGMKNKK